MSKKGNAYASSGVDYDLIDPIKVRAQKAAQETEKNLPREYKIIPESRGESAYFVQIENYYVAFVQEGLGTKNLVADEMYKLTGKSHYDQIAQDTVAAIINDLITIGAKPHFIDAYWAVGSSDWFKDNNKSNDLIEGWKNACNISGVTWGGGETPVLTEIIGEDKIDLAGSAVGIIKPKERLTLGDRLQAGDAILVFESSGIHTNGLTLARQIAERLPDSYKTKLGDGTAYGEALLTPSIIYAKLINELFEQGVEIHYMVHITGHGWRKLMRASKPFTYRIKEIPPVPQVLQFIQEKAELSDEEAYGTFNMGAGYAVFISQAEVERVLQIAEGQNIKAYNIGVVEEGEKQVIIEPKNITYKAESLRVRA